MKYWAAAIVCLALTSDAGAATVTFILSPYFDGAAATPAYSPNTFSLYAFTSAGDNAGLASFSARIIDAYGFSSLTSVRTQSPRAYFSDELFENDRVRGFTLLRSSNFTGRTSGYPVYGAIDTVTPTGIVDYDIGQKFGTVASPAPDGFMYQPSPGYRPQYGASGSGGILTPPFLTYGQVPVLLATGTMDTGAVVSVGDLQANVFNPERNGYTSAATVQFVYGPFSTTPEPAGLTAMASIGTALLRRRRLPASAIE